MEAIVSRKSQSLSGVSEIYPHNVMSPSKLGGLDYPSFHIATHQKQERKAKSGLNKYVPEVLEDWKKLVT